MVRPSEGNERLWDTEDRIRMKESQCEFSGVPIELAGSAYLVNDERAAIKRALNLIQAGRGKVLRTIPLTRC